MHLRSQACQSPWEVGTAPHVSVRKLASHGPSAIHWDLNPGLAGGEPGPALGHPHAVPTTLPWAVFSLLPGHDFTGEGLQKIQIDWKWLATVGAFKWPFYRFSIFRIFHTKPVSLISQGKQDKYFNRLQVRSPGPLVSRPGAAPGRGSQDSAR